MSNFTRSIVYSGVVLAAGLVAIFSIYNNMQDETATTQVEQVQEVEPAAGSESISPSYKDTFPEKNCEEIYKICKAG